jgi:hypothetical protein
MPKTANEIAKVLSARLPLVCFFSEELFFSLDDCRILMMARTAIIAAIIMDDVI